MMIMCILGDCGASVESIEAVVTSTSTRLDIGQSENFTKNSGSVRAVPWMRTLCLRLVS